MSNNRVWLRNVVAFFAFPACLALASAPAEAGLLLDKSGKFGPEPQSGVVQLPLETPETPGKVLLDAEIKLERGRGSLRVVGRDGKAFFEFTGGGAIILSGQKIDLAGKQGPFRVEIVPHEAVGTWKVRVATPPDPSQAFLAAASGFGMTIVGLTAVLLWRWWSGAPWRWFWAGAAVWAVGVFLKFAFAIPLNGPILGALKEIMPHDAYMLAGSLYIGSLTGVFEIGITLAAALVWRQMARDSARGVAVGVGAGAIEAMLLGAGMAAGVLILLAVKPDLLDARFAAQARMLDATPLWWLAGSVERVIAILCHTSSRALLLWGIARRRWVLPFAVAFLLMSAIDAVAGWTHLSGFLGKGSLWWIELAIAPAAVVSIPIIAWCVAYWPASGAEPRQDDPPLDPRPPAGPEEPVALS